MQTKQKISHDYNEWQLPPYYSFLPPLLFIPAIWLVLAPFDLILGFYVGFAFFILTTALKLVAAKRILVSSTELKLGSAVIPRSIIGEVQIIDREQQFFERGARLNANAFTFLKYGLAGMLKIEVVDSKDPTPYLLVSTRNPKVLFEVLKH